MDNSIQGFVSKCYIFLGQAVFRYFFRHEKTFSDAYFLLIGITGKAEHFHSIEQWLWNGVQDIGGTDKKDIGKVVIDFQIMVVEIGVLFRIQNLQQSGGGVSSKIGIHFVDLIEHENRVVDTSLFDALNDFSW